MPTRPARTRRQRQKCQIDSTSHPPSHAPDLQLTEGFFLPLANESLIPDRKMSTNKFIHEVIQKALRMGTIPVAVGEFPVPRRGTISVAVGEFPVPRRGTISVAVGETHGPRPSNPNLYRPRRGRTFRPRRGVGAVREPPLHGARQHSTPSGLRNGRGASLPWVSPTATDIGPLRGPFRGVHPELLLWTSSRLFPWVSPTATALDLFAVPFDFYVTHPPPRAHVRARA